MFALWNFPIRYTDIFMVLSFAAHSCHPASLPNGTVSAMKVEVGDSVFYKCNTGYYIIGGQNRTCSCNSDGCLLTGRRPACYGMPNIIALDHL